MSVRLWTAAAMAAAGFLALAGPAGAASVFAGRIDDPKAVYVTAKDFGAHADGVGDDTAALQAAIDKANTAFGEGIVFLPSGRYRLTHTVYLWSGVRIIGYGPTRPVLTLADNTPGFQSGVADMVMFASNRPGAGWRPDTKVAVPPQGTVPLTDKVPDANSDTFYSVMSNIDFQVGRGNPAAIAVRFHVAQHAYLSHMDFHMGSGLAALTQVGNVAYDLRIFGGRYGILTEKTSPAWQFTLLDSLFEGQGEAAIREHEVGLTLVRDTFRRVPVAIAIDPQYSDELWVKDSRFEHIAKAVATIANEQSPMTEVGFQDAICVDAPVFARFDESGRTVAGSGPVYRVHDFTHGLIVPGEGQVGAIGTRFDAAPLAAAPQPLGPAMRSLPPVSDWTNVHDLGVKGDGVTDDTAAIQAAIDAHRVLYFPSGYYVVRDTLRLKPDTMLIGLHPNMTQLDLPDLTPAYQGVGSPKPLVETAAGGDAVVTGLGFDTGGFNPRVVSLKWMAGEGSLADDLQFHFGGPGFAMPAAAKALFSVPKPPRAYSYGRWGGKYPSIWVTAGGGGTFNDIWTPDTTAQAGLYVSDTKTPGHIYELSNEHHPFSEIRLDHVENWDINAPQTEEEAPTSPESVSIEIDDSRNITIANYHAYRVTRTHAPFPAAVRLYNASDIHFRNLHTNAESGYSTCDANGCDTWLRVSKFPYENAIQDMTHHLAVREREFAALDIPADPPAPPVADASAVLAPGAKVEKLEDGFFALGGATVDAAGKLYFVDHHQQRIFSWSQGEGLKVVRDDPLDPVSLAFDKSGELIVLSSAGIEGTVYALKPAALDDAITVLQPQAAAPQPGAVTALPVNYWINGEFRDQLDPATYRFTIIPELFARDVTQAKARQYVSPDGSLVLPAGRVFTQGPDDSYPGMDDSGWRWSDNLDATALQVAQAGQKVYVVSGAEDRTYSAVVGAGGALSDLKPFAERGGESVAVDGRGNVYVANGQVFVYDPAGELIGRIDTPERPLDILFGGPDRRTLFILGYHGLYAVETRAGG